MIAKLLIEYGGARAFHATWRELAEVSRESDGESAQAAREEA